MTRPLRLLLMAVSLISMSATGASAAQISQEPGASCSNTSSAINQYCEDIPSATGGSPSLPGAAGPAAPTLGATLPQNAVRAYKHLSTTARTRARKLLSLPAPVAAVPISASISAQKGAWSLPTGLVLAMVAIAAACGGAAIARRRQGRAG